MFTAIDPLTAGFIVFCIFMGAGYQFVDYAHQDPLPWWARLFRQLVAVFFLSTLALHLLRITTWSPLLIGLGGGISGMLAERLLRMINQFITSQDSLPDTVAKLTSLLNQLGKGIQAFYGAFKSQDPPAHE